MAQYQVTKVEVKNQDWKIVDLKAADGYITSNASVNRVNKKGETFPNFDGIVEGATINAELWKSDAGKWYVFAPKVAPTVNSARSGGNMKAMMEKKEKAIEGFQENKEWGIMTSGTLRDAVLIVTSRGIGQMSDGEIERAIVFWRNWLIENYEVSEKKYAELTNKKTSPGHNGEIIDPDSIPL